MKIFSFSHLPFLPLALRFAWPRLLSHNAMARLSDALRLYDVVSHCFLFRSFIFDFQIMLIHHHRPIKKKGGTSAGLPKESRPRSPGIAGAVGSTAVSLLPIFINCSLHFLSHCCHRLFKMSQLAYSFIDHECDSSEKRQTLGTHVHATISAFSAFTEHTNHPRPHITHHSIHPIRQSVSVILLPFYPHPSTTPPRACIDHDYSVSQSHTID